MELGIRLKKIIINILKKKSRKIRNSMKMEVSGLEVESSIYQTRVIVIAADSCIKVYVVSSEKDKQGW